jgi:two-component system LytT family response regulator
MEQDLKLQKQELQAALHCIILADKQSKYVLQLNSILRLESKRVYTIVYFKDRKELVCSRNLKVIFEILNSKDFFRVHRSHVINLREIKSIEYGKNGKIIMSDNSKVSLSQRKKSAFMKVFYQLVESRA